MIEKKNTPNPHEYKLGNTEKYTPYPHEYKLGHKKKLLQELTSINRVADKKIIRLTPYPQDYKLRNKKKLNDLRV